MNIYVYYDTIIVSEESQESLIKLRTEMEKQIEQREKEVEKGNNDTTLYYNNVPYKNTSASDCIAVIIICAFYDSNNSF